MKTLYIVTLIFALSGIGNHAISQNLIWGKRMGGANDDWGNSITYDANGNVYTTGVFTGPVDIDPGPGIYNLTGNGTFILKLDISGNFIWAKHFEGAYGTSSFVDATGNVYTTGSFRDTANFNPGIGMYNLIASGFSYDVFISKLDASGNLIWAKGFGGPSLDRAKSIAVDINGNTYTVGTFGNQVDFDPGPGIYNLSCFGTGIFVSKLDSSGNFVWAKQMGGNQDDYGISMAIDSTGNIYTTGTFMNTADFDPGAGVFNLIADSVYTSDVFISKLNASGNFVWAKKFGGKYDDFVNSITIDVGGNIYTTGNFIDTVDFDPGTGIYNLVGYGVFVSKLDASGNFLWAKNFEGPVLTNSIVTDAVGNVYTAGWFSDTVDFDPGIGTYILSFGGINGDAFISKLSASGNFISASQFKGMQSSQGFGYSISVDALGNIYVTGYFRYVVDFDPGAAIYNLTSAGNDDIYIVKLNNITSVNEHGQHDFSIKLSPNPGSAGFEILYLLPQNKNGILSVYDLQGRLMHKQILPQWSTMQHVPASNWAGGVYQVRIESDGYFSTNKWVKY